MRRLVPLLVVAAVSLAAAPAASAKWCARISVTPARPAVGQPVTLRLRSFESVLVRPGWGRPGKPTRIGGPRMLLVVPPRGDADGVEVKRRRDAFWIWETRFVFRRPGLWHLRHVDEAPLGPGCRGRIKVRVAPLR